MSSSHVMLWQSGEALFRTSVISGNLTYWLKNMSSCRYHDYNRSDSQRWWCGGFDDMPQCLMWINRATDGCPTMSHHILHSTVVGWTTSVRTRMSSDTPKLIITPAVWRGWSPPAWLLKIPSWLLVNNSYQLLFAVHFRDVQLTKYTVPRVIIVRVKPVRQHFIICCFRPLSVALHGCGPATSAQLCVKRTYSLAADWCRPTNVKMRRRICKTTTGMTKTYL